MTGCVNSGDVSLFSGNQPGDLCHVPAGGIAGQNNSTVNDCANYGHVSSSASGSLNAHCGGLAGWNNGHMLNSGSMGSISSGIDNGNSATASYTGGAAGISKGSVFNCFSNCGLSASAANGGAKSHAGGFVGYNFGKIQNCYSTGFCECLTSGSDGSLISPSSVCGSSAGTSDPESSTKYCFYDSGTYSGPAV